MPLTFIHSADWQIGRPFASVEDASKRTLLQSERIAAIARIGAVMDSRNAAFLLVAGDLFDTATPSKATVSQACSAIGALKIPVFVIPGNHDHGGPGAIWEQDFFQQEQASLAPNLRLLLTPEPVELDHAVLFPCPLLRRHEAFDPTAWLRDPAVTSGFGDKPRILLAHGTVQGFGAHDPDDEESAAATPNLLAIDRLLEDAFDYLALGDWHGTKQVAPRAWYAGTPEPDRFPKGDSHHAGHVLAVTLERGAEPQVEPLPTGRVRWHRLDFAFSADDDLESLQHQIDQLIETRAGSDLLELKLRGSLGIKATTRLEACLETWEARLLRLKLRNETRVAPTEAEIEALTRSAENPLIARVARRLVALAAARQFDGDGEGETNSGSESEVARIALRELHAAAARA